MLVPATVRVPGSTSNLGAGFDTLGLAVCRYLTARFQPGPGDLAIRRQGTLAGLDVSPRDDLLLSTFVAELARRGREAPGGTLTVTSELPVGRGLGASAAAVVAGLLLAAHAAGDAAPDLEHLLREATHLEGHADNAAPSLHGGLIAVVPVGSRRLRCLSLPLSPDVAFAYAAPPVRLSTAAARAALPSSYPRPTAVLALGRLAALLHGLAHADPETLAVGLADEIHAPYRLALIPGGEAVLRAATDAGAWGATVSGSGSGMLAVAAHDRIDHVALAMAAAFADAGHARQEVIAFRLEPERRGGHASPEDAPATLAAMGGAP